MGKHTRLIACGRSGMLAALAAGLWVSLVHAQEPAPLPADVAAKLQVLDHFRGTWDATLKTTRPTRSVVTYTETYTWVLGGRFLHGDTGLKSDGVRDTIMGTYDPASGGYPFWIFSSSGVWFYLSPGSWNEASRTLQWKNAHDMTVSYQSRCTFSDAKTRRWSVLVKDWKGSVLLEQEGSAVRREP
jgi:hypothetical protein